jgi:hypothetical protein
VVGDLRPNCHNPYPPVHYRYYYVLRTFHAVGLIPLSALSSYLASLDCTVVVDGGRVNEWMWMAPEGGPDEAGKDPLSPVNSASSNSSLKNLFDSHFFLSK